MAHTLKAYYYTDPATAVTVDFYGAVADNDGIAVDSYQMGVPGIEQARNNSLYSDSPRPVYSKHGTVTDVLTVTVRGSTNTLLYTNLHLLAKLGEYARAAQQTPLESQQAYLKLKPGGSSSGENLYATIYDCRIELPADWANTQDATLMVEDVTVTIERGIWAKRPPSYPAESLYPNADTNIEKTSQAFASSGSSSLDIGGDTSAQFFLFADHQGSTSGAIDRMIIGYRSKAQGGTYYANLGKREAESETLGTDTSDTVDATGSGGHVARCTQTTSPSTPAARVSKASIVPYGTHRVFARMKITSTAVSSVYMNYQDETTANGSTLIANAAVSVSSTSWLVYDLGVVRSFQSTYGVILDGSVRGSYSLYSSLTSGSGNLDIDWVYFMPTEGYVTLQNIGIGTSTPTSDFRVVVANHYNFPIATVIYGGVGSNVGTVRTLQNTISLDPLPGPFALYWLAGTDSGSVFDVGILTSLNIGLHTNPRYLMPSLV